MTSLSCADGNQSSDKLKITFSAGPITVDAAWKVQKRASNTCSCLGKFTFWIWGGKSSCLHWPHLVSLGLESCSVMLGFASWRSVSQPSHWHSLSLRCSSFETPYLTTDRCDCAARRHWGDRSYQPALVQWWVQPELSCTITAAGFHTCLRYADPDLPQHKKFKLQQGQVQVRLLSDLRDKVNELLPMLKHKNVQPGSARTAGRFSDKQLVCCHSFHTCSWACHGTICNALNLNVRGKPRI